MIEQWRQVWRKGLAPQMTTRGLESLADALRTNDPRLIQGSITSPPPLYAHTTRKCEGACPVAWVGWHGADDVTKVGEVEDAFHRLITEADHDLQGKGFVDQFFYWWDEAPSDDAVPELLAEVEMELARRHQEAL